MNKDHTRNKSFIRSSDDGVILISMSIGIFLIISIFTFFLMRLVVKEHNMSLLHSLDVKTRNLAHSALERGIYQFNNNRNISEQNGILNNGTYNITFDGINDENNLALPYSHFTMLKSEADINNSKRMTRIFLSSFPPGFNPAFYGENISNNIFSGNGINGGYLFKKDGSLYHNSNFISFDGIKESMPFLDNFYDDEINWTAANVAVNHSNPGIASNNYLKFDGNDRIVINYIYNETTMIPQNSVINFDNINFGYDSYGNPKTWGYVPSGYMGYNWHSRIYAAKGNWYGTGDGYFRGMYSSPNIIYNAWNEQNVYFESSDGSLFNFINIHGAAAWSTNNWLTIKGYRNGVLVETKSFQLTNNQGRWYSWYNAPINDVNKIVFSNSDYHWSLDQIILQKMIPQTTINSTLPYNNEPRTIAAWVKPTSNINSWGAIVTTGTGDCTGNMFGLGRMNGKLALWGGCKDWITNLSIPYNEWSFVAITYDGVYVKAYVNGNSQQTTLNNFNTQISNLFIGAETTNNGASFRNYWHGDIDEVAIWNESISQSEITALYNQGSGLDASTNSGNYTSSSNLRGYWKLNEGAGTTVYDNSANGKNGTVYGASWQTGSHSQPQPSPLVLNSGTTINLNAPDCGPDHTSLCTNNKIAVNHDIIFEDIDIIGTGYIISTGKIVLKQNTTASGGITFIADKIEINNSSLGNASLFNSSTGPVIIYTDDGGSITNSNNVSGLIINYDLNNSASFIIDNSKVYGAILNYSSNFQLNNYSHVYGSVVSQYLVSLNNFSEISKGNLPSFYGVNNGLSSSVIPGSYLEY